MLSRSTYSRSSGLSLSLSLPPLPVSLADTPGPGLSRALPLNFAENMFGYFEINPVVTIPMSREGIKMMIGSFGLWFGTAEGDRLRKWSADRGWPLAWAYNPRVAGACDTGPQPPPAGLSLSRMFSHARLLLL